METVFNFSTWPPIQCLLQFPFFRLEAPSKTERGALFLTCIFSFFRCTMINELTLVHLKIVYIAHLRFFIRSLCCLANFAIDQT